MCEIGQSQALTASEMGVSCYAGGEIMRSCLCESAMPGSLANSTPNRILARLAPGDLDLLKPHLEAVDLPFREKLEVRNKPIEHVYFIERGVASVVANVAGDRSIEVGVIGREGVTGLAVIMGADRSPHEIFMQIGGGGQRIAAVKLDRAIKQSAGLHWSLLRYGHAFVVQMGYTALANGRSKIEERLARWLLMAHDRVDGDLVPLTHEFLATMLGVQRPGVTVALGLLENRGLIQAERGVISIADRKGLEEFSNGAYGAPEAEFRRLFG
jgi:CRP-like cAMP-binding protein